MPHIRFAVLEWNPLVIYAQARCSITHCLVLPLFFFCVGAHHEGPTFTVLSSLMAAKQEAVPWGTLGHP